MKLFSASLVAQQVRNLRLVVFDFDGVFTDNTVYVSEDGTESVRCWRGDGLGLAKLRSHGIESLIISTETNQVVSARARKLNMECVQGCNDKLRVLENIVATRHLLPENVAFVGNDINDLECLRYAAVGIVVQDAHVDVVLPGLYQTSRCGGFGAVREVCDVIAEIMSGPHTGPGARNVVVNL